MFIPRNGSELFFSRLTVKVLHSSVKKKFFSHFLVLAFFWDTEKSVEFLTVNHRLL